MKFQRVNPPSLLVWEMPVGTERSRKSQMANVLHENIHATRVATLFAEEMGTTSKILYHGCYRVPPLYTYNI